VLCVSQAVRTFTTACQRPYRLLAQPKHRRSGQACHKGAASKTMAHRYSESMTQITLKKVATLQKVWAFDTIGPVRKVGCS
jgi:hypothetical protein